MPEPVITRLQTGIILSKNGGFVNLLKHLKNVFYYTEKFTGMERIIRDNESIEVPPAAIPYECKLASDADIQQILDRIPEEKSEAVFDLVRCIKFYDSGYRRCYIAKNPATNVIYAMQWLIAPWDKNIKTGRFETRYSKLKNNEFLFENSYTFEKFRGKGISTSLMAEMVGIVNGIARTETKRIMVYINSNNTASIRVGEKVGFSKFEEKFERKLFLNTNIKTVNNRYAEI